MAGRYFFTHIYNMHLMNRSSISFSLSTNLNLDSSELSSASFMASSDFVADGAHDVWGNGDAARDHRQNDHGRRQSLVLPLCYSMNIPRASKLVR